MVSSSQFNSTTEENDFFLPFDVNKKQEAKNGKMIKIDITNNFVAQQLFRGRKKRNPRMFSSGERGIELFLLEEHHDDQGHEVARASTGRK